MPEMKSVAAIISNCSAREPHGRITIGYYIMEDGLLTMTDGEGAPFRSTGGDRITHRLQADDDPTVIAKRLTLKIYRKVRGGDMAGFNRPLSYPVVGVA